MRIDILVQDDIITLQGQARQTYTSNRASRKHPQT